MLKHVTIKIIGRVQGVSFRYYTLEKAKELNVNGFIRNEHDGSVYVEAEGEKDALKHFIDWCGSGPSLAKVLKVRIVEGELKNFSDFTVC